MEFNIVMNNSKKGLVDNNGKVVIPFDYDEVKKIEEFNNLYKVIKENEDFNSSDNDFEYKRSLRCGVYDINQHKEIVPSLYQQIDIVDNRFFLVKKYVRTLGEKYDMFNYGVFNKDGEEIVPTIWGGVEYITNGYFVTYYDYIDKYLIKSNDCPLACFIIDKNGQMTDIRDRKWGIFRQCGKGTFVSQASYDEYGDFVESNDEKYSLLSSDGEELTDFVYRYFDDEFDEKGFMIIEGEDEGLGVLRFNYGEIIPTIYYDIEYTEEGIKCYKEEDNEEDFDLYDKDGNLLNQ